MSSNKQVRPARMARRAPVALAVLMAISSPGTIAATRNWTGAGGVDNFYWDVPNNWGAASPPLVGDAAELFSANTSIRSGAWELSTVSGTGTLTIGNGSLSLWENSSLDRLEIDPGGALGGAGRLQLTNLNWQTNSTQGLSSSLGGTTAVSGLTTFGYSGNGNKLAYGRKLELNGDATASFSTINIGGAGSEGGVAYGASTVSLAAGKTLTLLDRGADITGDGSFNNSGTVVTTGAGSRLSIRTNFVNSGTIDSQVGTSVSLPSAFSNPGRLIGAGRFEVGTLTNDGHIAPGESPGKLTVSGNLVQTAAGTLDIEMESLSSFDQLVVSGATTLGGTLDIVCYSNCRQSVGQSFLILDGAPNKLDGTFASVVLTGFAQGEFAVVYDRVNGDVLLNVTVATLPEVPEPTTTSMFLSGLVYLAASIFRRYRRKTAVILANQSAT